MTGARRRIVALLLVAVVTLAFTGCDSIRSNAKQTFEPRHPGVLTVATSLPAPGFWNQDAQGTFTGGFEFDVATALAARFGLTLNVIDVSFEDITQGELHGADVAFAHVSITDERAKSVAFSEPYYSTGSGVLVQDGNTIADLKTAREKSWCVARGTTQAAFLADVVQPTGATIERNSEQECAEAVTSGTADAALADLISAIVLQGLYAPLAVTARFTTNQQYAAVVERSDDQLEFIDAGIRALKSDGSLRDYAGDWLTSSVDPSRIPVIVTGNS